MKLILIICLALVGCSTNKVEPNKKPFIIIDKEPAGGLYYDYRYESANGFAISFRDTVFYKIGDTIR